MSAWDDESGPLRWTVDFRGVHRVPMRLACALLALTDSVWVFCFVLPSLVMGVLVVFGYLTERAGYGAYVALCACTLAALGFLSTNYRRVWYIFDADDESVRVARDGYEVTRNSTPQRIEADSPAVALTGVESVQEFPILRYMLLRVTYESGNLFKPNLLVVPSETLNRLVERLERTDIDGRAVVEQSSLTAVVRVVVTGVVLVLAPILLTPPVLYVDMLLSVGLLVVAITAYAAVKRVRQR